MNNFFNNFSSICYYFVGVSMTLNDVDFPIDSEEILGKVLIDNLGKITVHNFTFHINCLIPFHSGYWDKLFIIRFLRNWKIFAFGKEFSSEDEFDKVFFKPLLKLDSSELKKEYCLVSNSKNLVFDENNEFDVMMMDILNESYSFLFSVDSLVEEHKIHFSRNKKYLHYFLENNSLIALLSQNSFDELCSLINDDGLLSDFINIAFVKCLQLASPSLLPSYIAKTVIYSKYLNLDSLGFLYQYTQKIYSELKETFSVNRNSIVDSISPSKALSNDISKRFQKSKDKHIILLKALKFEDSVLDQSENSLDKEINLTTRIYLWKLSSFKDLNFSSNLFLSSLSSKFSVEKMVISYWKRFKLQPPAIFFNNSHIESHNNPLNFKSSETIHIKKQLNSYYRRARNVLTRIELSNVDDIFGDIIMEIVFQLPALKRLEVCNLNLGDNFCLGLSDYLIERRIRNMSTGIHFDLSRNLRISNVGLKFLYVGMEFSGYVGSLSDITNFEEDKTKNFSKILTRTDIGIPNTIGDRWLGKENYNKPTLMIDDIKMSNSTFILDHGLGVYLEELIYSYTGPQKFYCENCEEFVCSKCHKMWSLHTINKKCNDIEQNIDFDINECKEFNSQMRNAKKCYHLTNSIVDFITLVWLIRILCFILQYTIIFSRWLSGKIERFHHRIMKFLFGEKGDHTKPKKTKWRCYYVLLHFLFGHDSDPEFDIENFSYHINVTTVDNYIHKLWILLFILTGYFGFIAISIFIPLYTDDIGNYIGIFLFLLICIIGEIYLMSRVINLLNRGMKRKIAPNFSIVSYGSVIMEGAAERFDTFSDFMFLQETASAGNIDLLIASIVVLVICFFIYSLQAVITGIKMRKTLHKRGKANFNINMMSRLCVITENKGIASLLDVYSTKNAVKINGKFYPQIIISSSIKFFIENLPQFTIQLIHVFRSDVTFVVALSISMTIYGLISAFITTLNAKASILTKNMILKKFSEIKLIDNLEEDGGRINLVVETEKKAQDNFDLPNLSSTRIPPLTERTSLISNRS